MKNGIPLALSLWLLCFMTGCLEFERQTMSFRHDSDTDTLYIFQDYPGIFGEEDPVSLTEAEMDQMASVMQGERTFFFNNWITEYNRKLLTEKQQTPKGELDADEAYEASIRALLEAALANVKVENVGFYLNRQNQLCGAQRVTVKNISKVLAALNKVLLFVARDEAGKDDKSEVQKKLLLKFAESSQKALRLDGNRLEIRWPATAEDCGKFKDQTPQGRAFRESGGEVNHTDGMIILTLGKKDAKSVSLTMPFSDKPYSDNSLIEATKYGVMEWYDAIGAAKTFLEGAASMGGRRK
jgi:hypothetical protein